MRRAIRSGVLALTVVLGGVACGSSEGGSEDTTTTSTTALKSFEISTDAGQISLSLDGQLPPGWPASFPVPDGAEPAGSGSLGGADSATLVAVYTGAGTPQDAFDFYTTDQTELPVESRSSLGTGQTYIGTVSLGDPQPARVTVLPKDGETLIVIALTTDGAGTSSTTAKGSTTTAAKGSTTTKPSGSGTTATTAAGSTSTTAAGSTSTTGSTATTATTEAPTTETTL